MKTTWALAWRIAAFFIVWGTLAAPFFLFAQSRLESWREGHAVATRLLVDSVAVAALVAATWIIARFADKRDLAGVGLGLARTPRAIAVGVCVGAVWLALPLALAWAAGWTVPVEHTQFPWGGMPLAALGLVVNVVAQQLLLTGYVFAAVRSRAGLIAAVVISGVLFCGYHAPAFQGGLLPAINVFLTATLFCLARELSGSIWLPVGIHAAWNFLLGPVLGLTVSGTDRLAEGWQAFQLSGPVWATGGGFGFEGSVPVALTTAMLIVAFVDRLRRGPAQAGASPSGQM